MQYKNNIFIQIVFFLSLFFSLLFLTIGTFPHCVPRTAPQRTTRVLPPPPPIPVHCSTAVIPRRWHSVSQAPEYCFDFGKWKRNREEKGRRWGRGQICQLNK